MNTKLLSLLLAAVLAGTGLLRADAPPQEAPAAKDKQTPRLIIESTGRETGEDAFKYDMGQGYIVQGGGVRVTYGDFFMTCESVVARMEAEEVFAEGHVLITDGQLRITAERVYFDLKKQHGIMEKARIISGLKRKGTAVEWVVYAERLIRRNRDVFIAEDAWVSTCSFHEPHYRLACSTITIIPGYLISAWNMVLYVGSVPVFYYPYFRHDLQHDWLPHDFKLGSSSTLGDYLKTTWKLYSNDWLNLLLRLDFTARRGNGIGLDLEYGDRDWLDGWLHVYVINDDLLNKQRDRITWRHYEKHEEAGFILKADAYSYSDRDMGFDFFKSEYLDHIEYAPYLQIRQVFDIGEVDLLYSGQTNAFQTVDYYGPAMLFGLGPYQLHDRLYLDFETFAARDGRAYDELLALPDLEREKLNSRLKFSLLGDFGPFYFDCDVGQHFAWYDEYLTAVDSKSRHQTYIEVKTGTKFIADFNARNPLLQITGLRHIIEPYIRYFHGFEPSILNADVEQLDPRDDLREDRYIQPGLRTSLDTESNGIYRNLLTAEAFLRYRSDESLALANSGGEKWGDIGFTCALKPLPQLGVYFAGAYDPGDSAFEELFSGIRWKYAEQLVLHFEDYRTPNSRSEIAGAEFSAGPRWSMGAFARYDAMAEEYSDWRWFVTRVFHMWELTFISSYDLERDERSFGFGLKLIGNEDVNIAQRHGSMVAADLLDDYMYFER